MPLPESAERSGEKIPHHTHFMAAFGSAAGPERDDAHLRRRCVARKVSNKLTLLQLIPKKIVPVPVKRFVGTDADQPDSFTAACLILGRAL